MNRYITLRFLSVSIMVMMFFTVRINLSAQDPTPDIGLEFIEEDSLRFVEATLTVNEGDSAIVSVPDVDLMFFVQRTFSLLPFGDVFNTTDEEGKVRVEFPQDLPGDSTGMVEVIVKLEDADGFENTSASREIQWGVPVVIDPQEAKRSIWAARANAPIPLLILVNSLLVIVWGIIVYIIFQLYLILKNT